jgi:hypothetical protein
VRPFDLYNPDFLHAYWQGTQLLFRHIAAILLVVGIAIYVELHGLHGTFRWAVGLIACMVRWGLWTVFAYFVTGELILWSRALRVLGMASVGQAPRNVLIGLRSNSGLRLFAGVIPTLLALHVSASMTMPWYSARYPLVYALVAYFASPLFQLARPAAVLVLGRSGDRSVTLIAKAVSTANGQRVVSLLDPEPELHGATPFGMGANLIRSANVATWEGTVLTLLATTPIIVVDARDKSDHLVREGTWLFNSQHLSRAYFVVNEDGTSPLLQQVVSDLGTVDAERVHTMRELEVLSAILFLTRSHDNLCVARDDLPQALAWLRNPTAFRTGKTIDVRALLSQIVRSYAVEIRGMGRRVEVHVQARAQRVDGEAVVVRTALRNLFAVLLDAARPRTPIRIDAHTVDERIVVCFSVAPVPGWFESVSPVFDPTFEGQRAHEECAGHYRERWGPLYLARELVDAAGGSIQANSTGDGLSVVVALRSRTAA